MIAIYARQSVDKGEQSLSISSQIEECKKRISNGEHLEVFQDQGYSGANINRPAFTKMIEQIKQGNVNKVIVWKLDRISRSLLDFANIMAMFNQYNVSFDSVIDNFDTSSPMGRAMLNIVMVFAQLERETIQLRIVANYQKRAEKGFFLGGKTSFGLKKIPIYIDGYQTSTFELAENGNVVLELFDLYANTDISLGKLADYLNSKGITTNNNSKWESMSISRILHSPVYVKSNADIYRYYKAKGVNILSPIEDFQGNGLYIFGKHRRNHANATKPEELSIAVALHQGFIDSQTWLMVKCKLENNMKYPNSGKGSVTWLSGLLKCGICGYAITGQRTPKRRYLRCSRRINFKDCSGIVSLDASKVEDYLWDLIISKAQELKTTQLHIDNEKSMRVDALLIELAKIEEQIENLVNAVAESRQPTIQVLNRKIEELDKKRTEIIEKTQKESHIQKSQNTKEVIGLLDGELDFDQKKAIATALIEKIVIHRNGEDIEVYWKF